MSAMQRCRSGFVFLFLSALLMAAAPAWGQSTGGGGGGTGGTGGDGTGGTGGTGGGGMGGGGTGGGGSSSGSGGDSGSYQYGRGCYQGYDCVRDRERPRPRRPGGGWSVTVPIGPQALPPRHPQYEPVYPHYEPRLPPGYQPPRRAPQQAAPRPERRNPPPRRTRVAGPPPLPQPRPPVLAELADAAHEPDIVLIAVADGSGDAVADAIASANNLTVLERARFGLIGREVYRLRIEDGRPVATVLAALGADARVLTGQASMIFATQQGAAFPPGLQYAAAKLDLPGVHGKARGQGVPVAVIDTGVDRGHGALGGSRIRHVSVVGDDAAPGDHGTQITGIIAARDGLVGVAPDAEIIAIAAFRVSPEGHGEATSFGLLQALQSAHDEGARVINMSFAGGRDELMGQMLDALHADGVVLVAAAGNGGPEAGPVWPGAHPMTIAVTATDRKDALYADANRGDYVTVAAPGVEIVAPGVAGEYRIASGTSLAAAHVSGVAALLLERRPDLTPDEVREALAASALDLGDTGPDSAFGAGLVNPLAALAAVPAPVMTEAIPVAADAEP